MQQPNQSPPGCNPYAVNNKGIAHLLLILLLVAGLSVVGMFLFKMVSGGGLNVMGIRTSQAPDPACKASITCSTGYTKTSCIVSYNPYQSGYKCVANQVYWNYLGCSTSMPSCRSDQEVRGDCRRGDGVTGYRCVLKTAPPTTPPVTPPPSEDNPPKDPACNKKQISECSGGTYAQPCYYPTGGVPYGFKCTNVPLPSGYTWTRPTSCPQAGYLPREVILSYDPPGPARTGTYTAYRCMRAAWVGTIGLGGGFSGRVAIGVGDANFDAAVNGNIPRVNFASYAIPNLAYLVPQTGPWNYSNCNGYVDVGLDDLLKRIGKNELLNSCQPGQTIAFDCRRQSTWSILETGWRCVNNSADSGQCVYVVPNCAPGTMAQPCITVSASGQGSVNVNGIEIAGGQWQGNANAPLYRCVAGVNNTPSETNVNARPNIRTCYGGYNVFVSERAYAGCCTGETITMGESFKCIPNQTPPLNESALNTPVAVNTPPVIGVTAPQKPCITTGTSGKDTLPCCTSSAREGFVRIAGEGRVKVCYAPSTRVAIGPVEQRTSGTTPCVFSEGNRFSCGSNFDSVSEVCDSGGFICIPKDTDKDGKNDTVDPDKNGDNVPDYKQPSIGGAVNETIFIPPVGVGIVNDNPGNPNPPSNTCTTCVTVSGSFKTADGKAVKDAVVNMYRGDGSTAGSVTTNASGNYSLRFDKKGMTFAVRSSSSAYKPAKASYPECRDMSATGYENCTFRPQEMNGVDFVSTAAPVVYKAPTAEIANLSSLSPIKKGATVETTIFAKSEHSRIKKVTLYLNPAFSETPRCQSSAIGSLELYGLEGRWVKVGEKVYADSEAVASGFTTISWSTDTVPCSLEDGAGQDSQTCKKSGYFLAVNVEDMGGVSGQGTSLTKDPSIPVKRCSGNPLGHRACGSTYYDATCGRNSWSRIDILPSGPDVPNPTVREATIRAMGTPAGGVYPTMVLKANGVEIRRWTVTGTLADYRANVGNAGISNLTVHFTNDSEVNGSRNLRVDYLKLGNTIYQTEAATTKSLGSWSASNKCGEGFKASEWLHCNGYFQYMAPQPR